MGNGRYSYFTTNGARTELVPFVAVPKQSTDIFIYYEKNRTRFDKLSYDYYGDPNYGWLILQANPDLGCYEYLIPNNTRLRIPYPLATTLTQYNSDIDVYDKLYGLE